MTFDQWWAQIQARAPYQHLHKEGAREIWDAALSASPAHGKSGAVTKPNEALLKVHNVFDGQWVPSANESIEACTGSSLRRAVALLRSTGSTGDAIDAARLVWLSERPALGQARGKSEAVAASSTLLHCIDYAIEHGWPAQELKRIEGARAADIRRAQAAGVAVPAQDSTPLLRRLKQSLMRQRLSGPETVSAWARACTNAESDIEEWLAAAPSNPSQSTGDSVRVEGDLRKQFESWAAAEWDGKAVPDAAWLGFQGHAALAQQAAPAAEGGV